MATLKRLFVGLIVDNPDRAFRAAVQDYVLPALDNKAHATPSAARSKALAQELRLAGQHQGKAGAPADPTDTPKH